MRRQPEMITRRNPQSHKATCDYYDAWITDRYGNVSICNFGIIINNHFMAHPVDIDGEVSSEESVSFVIPPTKNLILSVAASADDMSKLTYTWHENDQVIEGAGTKELSVKPSANTSYTCRVSDQYGNSANCYFYINVENHLEVYPVDREGNTLTSSSVNLTLSPKEEVSLSVVASADDMSDLTYSWYDSNETLIEGEKTENLTVIFESMTTYYWPASEKTAFARQVYLEEGKRYYFVVSRNSGNGSCRVNIKKSVFLQILPVKLSRA